MECQIMTMNKYIGSILVKQIKVYRMKALLKLFLFGLCLIHFSGNELFAQNNLYRKIRTGVLVQRSLNYSLDGNFMVVGQRKNLLLFSAKKYSLIHKIKTPLKYINDVALSNDNKKIIVVGRKKLFQKTNKILIYNIDSLTPEKIISLKDPEIYSVSIAPDNKSLAIATNKKFVRLFDLDSNKFRYSFKNKREYVLDIAISPDGNTIASGGSGRKIWFHNLRDGQLVKSSESMVKWIRTITYSYSGKMLAAGDDAGFLNLLVFDKSEFKTLELRNSPKHKQKRIYGLAFSQDEKYLASSSNNQKFNIWNVEREKERFEASKKIRKHGTITGIQFDPNSKMLSTISFKDKYIRQWDISYLNITPKVFYKNESDKNPPQILITEPKLAENKATIFEGTVTIKGISMDETGIDNIFINGAQARISGTGEFEMTLKQGMGEQNYTIEANDVNGNTAVKKFSLIRKELNETDLNISFESKKYILAIGIDKYESWPMLSNAVYDVEEFKKVMSEKYNYPEENITMITNEEATKQGILNAFRKMIEKVKPNDNLIIYFSGHGHFDPVLKEGYWIPVGAKKGEDADYIPNGYLVTLLNRIDSKHTFLIADACFSGSLFGQSSRGFAETAANTKSRWGLTSGRLEYVSDGSSGTHSPFSKHLLEFLKNNQKEKVPVSELVQYIKINVGNESEQIPVGNPLKNVGDEGGEFIFEFKK